MKTGTKVLIGIAIFVAVVLFFSISVFSWGVSRYNGIQVADNAVDKRWGDVETSYQRRADLLPNLAETAKGYAKHENSTFKAIADARAQLGSVHVDAKTLTTNPQEFQKFQQMQQGISGLVSRLLMIQEAYPQLKADKHFSEMMTELEGTENRIKVARDDYNQVAMELNNLVETFPGSIINGMLNHKVRRNMFKADEGSKTAPKLNMTS